MRLLAALFLALVFSCAQAQSMSASDGGTTVVTIHKAACTNPAVLEQLPRLNEILAPAGLEADAEGLRAADVIYLGKAYAACWAELPTFVIVIDEAKLPNSIFLVPKRHFTPVTAI